MGESNGPSSTQLCTTQKFNLELFDRKRFSPRGENCCGKEHAEEEEIWASWAEQHTTWPRKFTKIFRFCCTVLAWLLLAGCVLTFWPKTIFSKSMKRSRRFDQAEQSNTPNGRDYSSETILSESKMKATPEPGIYILL